MRRRMVRRRMVRQRMVSDSDPPSTHASAVLPFLRVTFLYSYTYIIKEGFLIFFLLIHMHDGHRALFCMNVNKYIDICFRANLLFSLIYFFYLSMYLFIYELQ